MDAVTGQMRPGQALADRVGRMMNRDAMFDIGADTVGLLIPWWQHRRQGRQARD
jgi:hypothetical protein